MANPVCEVLLTEAQLNAPENHVDPAAGARELISMGLFALLKMGAKSRGIDYDAHWKMAEHQLKEIAEQAMVQFELRSVTVHHRVGFVAVGEPSLFLRVLSGHRQEAFQASQWMVDELKKKVPIWKRPRFKNHTQQGSPRLRASVAPTTPV